MHVVAAKAVAFGEALQPDFKLYAQAVVENAEALSSRLKERGAALVAGGTDTHLALVDLPPLRLTVTAADAALRPPGRPLNNTGPPSQPHPPPPTTGPHPAPPPSPH